VLALPKLQNTIKKYFYIKPLKFDSEKGIIKGLTFPLMRFTGYEIEFNSQKLFFQLILTLSN
jgi:hypothetical protein